MIIVVTRSKGLCVGKARQRRPSPPDSGALAVVPLKKPAQTSI
jgi:hypothetical protein